MGTLVLWHGVVMVERPDPAKGGGVSSDSPCKVRSTRNLELDGRRMIVHSMAYREVQDLFKSGDGDHVFVWATLFGSEPPHLELSKKRSTLQEWAWTSGPHGEKAADAYGAR